MKRDVKALVTGGGGEGAIGLIRILKNLGVETFSCDMTEFASGLYLADKWFLVPKAKEKEKFIESMRNIVRKNQINLVLSMVHYELPIFAELRREFKEKYNCDIISSPLETVEICNDKLKCIEYFKDTIPCPEVYQKNINFPCFIKLRNSSGTKNIHMARDKEEFDAVATFLKKDGIKLEEVVIQEYLPGKEYTIDTLCDFEGNLIVAVPRVRLHTKAGISTIGKTEKNEKILEYIGKITEKLKFYGPITIQFKEDVKGKYKLLEINPRFSGGLMITSAAGVNTLELLLKVLGNEKIRKDELEWEEKTTFRYLTEV